MTVQFRAANNGGTGTGTGSSQVCTLPTGWQAGDLCFVTVRIGNTGVTGFSQTSGTGAWNIEYSGVNSASTYYRAFAWRLLTATDTDPTFSWTTSAGVTFANIAMYSDNGSILTVDTWASSDPLDTSVGANTTTPNPSTANYASDASVIITDGRATAAGTPSSGTYTPPSGWTAPANGQVFVTQSNARFSSTAYKINTGTGTISPGSQSFTDNLSQTYVFTTVHATIKESIPASSPKKWFIKASDLIAMDKAGFPAPLRTQVLKDSIVGFGPAGGNGGVLGYLMPTDYPFTGEAQLAYIVGSIETGNTGGVPGLQDTLNAGGTLPGPFTYVMYDCESWSITPTAEQDNPFTYMATALTALAGMGLTFITCPAVDMLPTLSGYNGADSTQTNYLTDINIPSKVTAESNSSIILEVQSQVFCSTPSTYTTFASEVVSAWTGLSSAEIWMGLGTFKAGENYITLPGQLYTDWSSQPANRYWINAPSADHNCPQHAIAFWELVYDYNPVVYLAQPPVSAFTTSTNTTLTATISATSPNTTILIALTNDAGVATTASFQIGGTVRAFNTDYQPSANTTAHYSYYGAPSGATTVEVVISIGRANWGFTVFEVHGLQTNGTAAVVDSTNNVPSTASQTSWTLDPYNGGTPKKPNELVIEALHISSGTGVATNTSDSIGQAVDGATGANITGYRAQVAGTASADTLGAAYQGSITSASTITASAVAYLSQSLVIEELYFSDAVPGQMVPGFVPGTPPLGAQFDQVVDPTGIDASLVVPTPTVVVTIQATAVHATASVPAPTVNTGTTGTTISATAVQAIASVGTPTVVETVLPTGVQAVGHVGTPTIVETIPASGIQAVASVGTPTETVTISASGIHATASMGTPTVVETVVATGIQATASTGTPTETVTISATAVHATAALGTPTVVETISATGVQAIASVGTASVVIPAAGVQAVASTGTPTVVETISATGVQAVASAGTPTETITPMPTGIQAIASVGTPTETVTIQATAVQATASVATSTEVITISATAIQAVATVASPNVNTGTTDTTISATGVQAVASVGTPTVVETVLPTGIQVTASTGTPTVTETILASGIQAIAAVGTPTETVTISATAIHATATVPTTSVFIPATGVQAIASMASPTVVETIPVTAIDVVAASATSTEVVTITPTAVQAIASVPTPNISAGGGQTITPSGVQAIASVGTPTINVTISATAIQATASTSSPVVTPTIIASAMQAGSSVPTPTETITVPATGVHAIGTVSSPTVSSTISATGVQATASTPTPGLTTSISATGVQATANTASPGLVNSVTMTAISVSALMASPALTYGLSISATAVQAFALVPSVTVIAGTLFNVSSSGATYWIVTGTVSTEPILVQWNVGAPGPGRTAVLANQISSSINLSPSHALANQIALSAVSTPPKLSSQIQISMQE
jgi:hypothetical protein